MCNNVTVYQVDLFCRVVDNWGDAGVCWRLARQLTTEYGASVRLVIDDPAPLRIIAPDALRFEDDGGVASVHPGVEVVRWESAASATRHRLEPAPIVIEAFACDPPEPYVAAMAARARSGQPPVWINLEYLSAEAWVDGVHGLPSPHPRLPLTKYFFVPGFTAASGGLIRERAIRPLPDNAARQTQRPDPPRLFAFTYPDAPVAELADALGTTVTVAAPLTTRPGHVQPYEAVPQSGFDRVLTDHDLLLVRGEDSFVRAQLVGRPLLWHIYPTPDGAHLTKLTAWLDRYCEGMDPALAALYRSVSRWFADRETPKADLEAFAAALPALARHASAWQRRLCAASDLATRLRDFIATVEAGRRR